MNGIKEPAKRKVALITGITGQDGSYLAEFLLYKGYEVVGLKRRTSEIRTDRIDHIFNNSRFKLEYYDLNDAGRIWQLFIKYKPDEIYNLAAQSHVRVSFDISEHTVEGIAMGTLRMLNAMKEVVPDAKFYQASSSEMFGDNPAFPFNEESTLMPASPYACAKVFAHNLVRNYRQSYGLHASSGILFNHESPRRGETFVTRKITMAAAKIKMGLQDELRLGNLYAVRDWGFAGDFVEAMWLMLQQDEPDDYVISTGEVATVEEFLNHVFEYAGLGKAEDYVVIDPKFYRPHEVPYLMGDSSKAGKKLQWRPKYNVKKLAELMYDEDLDILKKEIK
jgi:GDPmannose 4,6-dehydratase